MPFFFGTVGPKELIDGSYDIVVNTSEIKNNKKIGWFPEIENSSLVAEVTVVDSASGTKETAIDTKGRFSISPFIISFNRCLKDFKPGLVSFIEADVNYIDGKPAKKIETVLTATADDGSEVKVINSNSVSDDDGRIIFGIHPEVHHNAVTVTIKTVNPRFHGSQATGQHKQHRFISKNQAYIAINRNSGKILKPGTVFTELVYIKPPEMINIYYMVISKGKILSINKFPSGKFITQSLNFPITYEMVPSIRVVVFTEHEGELVADSLSVDVSNECDPRSEVTITPEFQVREPGAEGKIVVRGSKEISVGLLAVDEAVYALSKRDVLTKSKMFKVKKQHDLGCGPGGGLTTDMVLSSAGVMIITKNTPDTERALTCEERIRRKRQIMSDKIQKYDGHFKKCCELAMKDDRYHRSCHERSLIVAKALDGKSYGCLRAFKECCLHKEQNSHASLPTQLARVGNPLSDLDFISEDDEKDEEEFLTTRSYFPESWIPEDFFIGPDGHEELQVSLPHSITTWLIQAVSVSSDHGMCIAAPQRVESFKKVFLQLNLPYSVVRNEQVEIPATLFNYGSKRLAAIVYMFGATDLCTGVDENEKSERQRLVVQPHSAETVAFPVIPMKEGTYEIKVTALSHEGSDSISRKLNVVSEGSVVERDITVMLDPSNQQKRSKRHVTTEAYTDSIDDSQNLQVTAIKLKAHDHYVPGTESCVISALGDQLGPSVQTTLENPEALLLRPHGCGEQNMIYLAPTLYTMKYLKAVNQITPERETKGYEFIRHGYANQLIYRKDDGSYGAWSHTPPSVWLTAFVIKVFCQASHLVYIDENVMCSGNKWLIDMQASDGSFSETTPVYHVDMMGGVDGKIPMTAFILITLEECNCEIPNLHITKARAMSYLEQNLGNVQGLLPTAIVAYALALSDSELKNAANTRLLDLTTRDEGRNFLYWQGDSPTNSIETTGYGLLTQLLHNDMEKSNAIVNWLNSQRLASGSYPSTQDTVVALQALSEYAIRSKSPGINLVSNVTFSSDRNFQKTMAFNDKNALVLQQLKVNKIGGMLFVSTGGQGVGMLSVKLRYNILNAPEELCKFDITVNVTERKEPVIEEDINYDIDGKDTFELLPDDLIRRAQASLDAPPGKEVLFDVDPRNREKRFIPRVYVNDTVNYRHKRNAQAENSNLVYMVEICTRFLGDREPGMSIVDAGIFSGFKPNVKDLDKLVTSPTDWIQRYELSSRGVVFYLEKVPITEKYCFRFHITREYIVGNTQTSIIKVYDYYNPDRSCSIFYSPDKNSPLLRKICKGGICVCAEGGCPPKEPFKEVLTLKGGEMRNQLRFIACEKHDYVWKGKVVGEVTKKDGFLHIRFHIDEVIKEGIEKNDLIEDETRQFLARDNCEIAKLVTDQEYLIMGKDGEKFETEEGEIKHRYLLDKSSKVHLWTPYTSAKHKQLQRALDWMRATLKKEGCNQ